jgi:hypothetical protein
MGKIFSGAARAATNVVKGVVQPVYNATLKQIPGVDKALVGLDKAVGKSIPGGWGTVAAVASSFIPGAQLAAMGMTKAGLATGLGALSGSGVMKKGHEFNLQGAIVGGAMAYGASQLATGLQEAGSTTSAIENAAKAETGQIAANLGVEGAKTGAGSQAAMLASQNAGFGAEGIKSIASGANQAIQSNLASNAANVGLSNLASNPDVFSGLAGTQQIVQQPTALQALGTNLTEAGKGTLSNIADAGAGIKNLTGFGTGASEAATKFAAPVTKEGVLAGVMGYSGMAALEEQQKALDAQKALGTIGDAEYAKAKASIDAQIATANQTVSANPFSSSPDRSFEKQDTLYAGSSPADTLYGKSSSDVSASKTLYAVGGSIDDESGMDEARGMMQGNMQKGLFGKGYAAGGQIDMGNGYNPFANLPSMSGPLGAAGQLPTAQTQPSFARSPYGVGPSSVNTTTEQDMTGGNRNGISGGLSSIFSGLGGSMPLGSSTANATPQPLGGQFAHNTQQVPTGPIFNSSTYQTGSMGSNSGASSSTYPGGYGGAGGSGGAFPLEGQYGIVKMAAGGMPRFLSGGGDGMSDSIKASINGTQEARLADGEFVIPADVVSHIGNGSSKAGAKQLYSMMDRVRQARVGTKKQGKQINPRKYMAA